MDPDQGNFVFYCPKLSTIVANRTEIKRMAFEHNRERGNGLLPEIVWSQAISASGNYWYGGNVTKVHPRFYRWHCYTPLGGNMGLQLVA